MSNHDTKGAYVMAGLLFLFALVLAVVLVLIVGQPEEPEYGWSRYSEKGKQWDARQR